MGERSRREPERTVLHRAVQAGWAAFVRLVAAKERSVPRFCQREIEAFLRCGVPAYGVARVHCDGCGADDVVAFSCKGRGMCPSCGAARMVDTAAWLCDAVLPEVAVRQWVLSLPYRVRALCAYDAAACALVRSVLVRAVSGFYERTAGRAGVPRPRTGAVAFVQRFDSALRLHVHFHVLWLDGAYGWVPGQGQPVFHAQPEVTDADVQLLVQRIRARVLRALRKAGKWVDEDAAADADCAPPADDLLPGLAAAAVAGRAAFGERAGRRDGRVGGDGRWRPHAKGPLCAELDGFSLHANTWVAPRDRERLEALCRYAARPAVSESRLAELPDGRIGYALKRRFADGTTAVVMTNAVLMERLCALVPPPRKHLATYHGVLAPASGLRPKVVPRQMAVGQEDAASAAAGCRHGAGGGGGSQVVGADNAATSATAAVCRQQAERRARARAHLRVPHRGSRRRSHRQRLPWADLLRRVFGIDVLVCPKCAGPRRVLAAIHDPAAIARVLAALGLTAAGADPAGCRAPPAAEGDAADDGDAAE